MTEERFPVVVVGAGAAGFMAAIFAARPDADTDEGTGRGGRRVILLERTKDGGRKILMSGGGRCNVLPSALVPERFVTASSPHTLKKLLLAWPHGEQRRFFEERLQIPLALEEETGKLFPVSNRARDVRDSLRAMAERFGVEVRGDSFVTGLTPDGGVWRVLLEGGAELRAGAVILSSGGLSVPATGSDGTGLDIARGLGHTIHETYPALTPLTAEPHRYAGLTGISLTVTLEAPASGRPGETRALVTHDGFLFTHKGYSGPAVLDISHRAVLSRRAGGPRQTLLVRWTELTAEAWDRKLREEEGTVANILRGWLPARLVEALLQDAAVAPATTRSQLRREERVRLVTTLTRHPLQWTGDEGYKRAEVTGGGVALDEIDPKTLESKRCPGLYLCGEILDAFGPIGGHNFSWAWATGRAAGRAAASR
jgi:predicted Rossmann fold flavoprotein